MTKAEKKERETENIIALTLWEEWTDSLIKGEEDAEEVGGVYGPVWSKKRYRAYSAHV